MQNPPISNPSQSPQRIAADLAALTKDFAGQRVVVCMSVQNRQYRLAVVPSTSALIIQALKEGPLQRGVHRGPRKHNGNISFEDVLRIARTMRFKSLAKDLVGTVKEVLGVAVSIGCTVDGMKPQEVTARVNEGRYEVPRE